METSADPDLDLLLVRFHLESGARREGALNLTLDRIDTHRCTVWLLEKFDAKREQPISPPLVAALEDHASGRGACSGEHPVLRSSTGRPITRRRYNTLFERAQAHLDWTKHTPVTAHVLRHTALTRVERLAGFAVAARFAGHSNSLSVTGTYIKAGISEVAAAIQTLTGERHPLAD